MGKIFLNRKDIEYLFKIEMSTFSFINTISVDFLSGHNQMILISEAEKNNLKILHFCNDGIIVEQIKYQNTN